MYRVCRGDAGDRRDKPIRWVIVCQQCSDCFQKEIHSNPTSFSYFCEHYQRTSGSYPTWKRLPVQRTLMFIKINVWMHIKWFCHGSALRDHTDRVGGCCCGPKRRLVGDRDALLQIEWKVDGNRSTKRNQNQEMPWKNTHYKQSNEEDPEMGNCTGGVYMRDRTKNGLIGWCE